MNNRIKIESDANGRTFEFTAQGNGNVLDVTDKAGNPVASASDPDVVLQKKIFNVRANSVIAMTVPRNKALLINGVKAEKSGAKVKGEIKGVEGEYDAHEYFNAYLNAVQMSVGIILPSAKAALLADGVRFSATCELVTTDNGAVMTLNPGTISILAPEKASKTTFDIAAMLGEEVIDAPPADDKKADAKQNAGRRGARA